MVLGLGQVSALGLALGLARALALGLAPGLVLVEQVSALVSVPAVQGSEQGSVPAVRGLVPAVLE